MFCCTRSREPPDPELPRERKAGSVRALYVDTIWYALLHPCVSLYRRRGYARGGVVEPPPSRRHSLSSASDHLRHRRHRDFRECDGGDGSDGGRTALTALGRSRGHERRRNEQVGKNRVEETNFAQPPDYVSEMDDEAVWRRLEQSLSEYRDLCTMRLETEEEAIGERSQDARGKMQWFVSSPQDYDPSIGQNVPSSLVIPYIHAVDASRLRELQAAGRSVLECLQEQFQKRNLSAQLLRDWGRLSAIAGALQLVYQGRSSSGGKRAGRAGAADNLLEHKKWYSREFLKIYSRGSRSDVESRLEEFINRVVSGVGPDPKGVGIEWFEKFLGPEDSLEGHGRRVTKAFLRLSVEAMRELAQAPVDDSPVWGLKVPYP